MNEASSGEHNDGLVICFIYAKRYIECDENPNSIGINAECNAKRSYLLFESILPRKCAQFILRVICEVG